MVRNTTPWTEHENAYIVNNINRKSVPSIAVALCRPYNETKCHVRYMTLKGMFKDVDMNRKVRPSSIDDVRQEEANILRPRDTFEETMSKKFEDES